MIALDANHDAIKPVFIMTFWQGQPALLEKAADGPIMIGCTRQQT